MRYFAPMTRSAADPHLWGRGRRLDTPEVIRPDGRLEVGERGVVANFNGRPVVEAGAFQTSVVSPEPESADEMQDGPGCRAQAGYTARIWRDFGKAASGA